MPPMSKRQRARESFKFQKLDQTQADAKQTSSDGPGQSSLSVPLDPTTAVNATTSRECSIALQ